MKNTPRPRRDGQTTRGRHPESVILYYVRVLLRPSSCGSAGAAVRRCCCRHVLYCCGGVYTAVYSAGTAIKRTLSLFTAVTAAKWGTALYRTEVYRDLDCMPMWQHLL